MVTTPWDRCKNWGKIFVGMSACMFCCLPLCGCQWWVIVLSVRVPSPRVITGQAYIKRSYNLYGSVLFPEPFYDRGWPGVEPSTFWLFAWCLTKPLQHQATHMCIRVFICNHFCVQMTWGNFCVQAVRGPGQLDNPAPGTIVDHTVTRREW